MPLVTGATDPSAFAAAATIADALSVPEDCLPPDSAASSLGGLRVSARRTLSYLARGTSIPIQEIRFR
jgi:hypothetical protein